MSNKYTSVYDWLKYIKANVVGINLRELRINSYVKSAISDLNYQGFCPCNVFEKYYFYIISTFFLNVNNI